MTSPSATRSPRARPWRNLKGLALFSPRDAARSHAALDEVLARHGAGLDAARPDAVAKRREQGRRTARENVADLVDEGTFVEYGPLIFAAQEAAAAEGGADRAHARRRAGRRDR